MASIGKAVGEKERSTFFELQHTTLDLRYAYISLCRISNNVSCHLSTNANSKKWVNSWILPVIMLSIVRVLHVLFFALFPQYSTDFCGKFRRKVRPLKPPLVNLSTNRWYLSRYFISDPPPIPTTLLSVTHDTQVYFKNIEPYYSGVGKE